MIGRKSLRPFSGVIDASVVDGIGVSDVGVVHRPAAVLPRGDARTIVAALSSRDVAKGGLWNVTPGIWQRYDRSWDGIGGALGSARLIGTIASAQGAPTRYDIVIYRVTLTPFGVRSGWSIESLCDDALSYAGLTLATCPRAAMSPPPKTDPFRVPRQIGPMHRIPLSRLAASESPPVADGDLVRGPARGEWR